MTKKEPKTVNDLVNWLFGRSDPPTKAATAQDVDEKPCTTCRKADTCAFNASGNKITVCKEYVAAMTLKGLLVGQDGKRYRVTIEPYVKGGGDHGGE